MQSFQDMNLPAVLSTALTKRKFTTPTPIQAQAIPIALEGRDIIGTAQTGTGKTLAFAVPLLSKLFNDPEGSALVLVPTRELAQQVLVAIAGLIEDPKQLRTALLIGGDPIGKQFDQLRARPRLVVGTPGRVIDHLKRGTYKAHNAKFLALDEADRMFDMGFGIQLEEIIKALPEVRQTMMFSATLAPNITKLAAKYLINPERISVGSVTAPAQKIKQEIVFVTEGEKYGKLLEQLNDRQGSIIIFVKTKMGADRLAVKLCKEDHRASAIHGDLRQHKRERVIRDFRAGKHRIMVATDVAARGLDIPHIEHVINYDLPPCPEDYIHRIGRTGRAGAEGFALCLIEPQDGRKWKAIHRLMNPNEPAADHPQGRSSGKGGFQQREGRGGFKGKSSGFKPRGATPYAGSYEGKSSQRKAPYGGKSDSFDVFHKSSKQEQGEFASERSYNDKPARPKVFGAKKFASKAPYNPKASFGEGKPASSGFEGPRNKPFTKSKPKAASSEGFSKAPYSKGPNKSEGAVASNRSGQAPFKGKAPFKKKTATGSKPRVA